MISWWGALISYPAPTYLTSAPDSTFTLYINTVLAFGSLLPEVFCFLWCGSLVMAFLWSELVIKALKGGVLGSSGVPRAERPLSPRP